MKAIERAEGVADAALRGMRPDEIDGMLADLDNVRATLDAQLQRILTQVHNGAGDLYKDRTGWGMTHTEALEKARARGDGSPEIYDRHMGVRGRAGNAIDRLENEYDRRGGWTRAWLVTDGHVHRSRNCSTCNNGEQPTRFCWLPEMSGKKEEEIVEAAGDRACTVCYPSAPVARGLSAPASSLSTQEERDREEARQERERARQEKAAKAALNAITNVDGTPLRDEVDGQGRQRGSIVKTIRTARSELKRECWYQYAWDDEDGRHERNIQHLARAIAWREADLPLHHEPTREQIDAVISPLRAKVVKEVDKARKDGR